MIEQGLLTRTSYIAIGDALKADPDFFQAVAKIESNEQLDAIRFENHKWRKYRFASRAAKKFDRKRNPRSMAKRWENFMAMDVICRQDALLSPRADIAAIYAHSFGAFQIMGFNHRPCGFESHREFLQAMKTAQGQVECMVGFIQDNPSLTEAVQRNDYVMFAFHFNGRNYHINRYDQRLASAHIKTQAEYAHV